MSAAHGFGPGKKFDTGKARLDLVPFRVVCEIAKVLTFGAEKYGANNWQNVEPFESRYFAALMRHLSAWRAGERSDPETGLPHLAHAGCCLVFLLSRELGFEPALDVPSSNVDDEDVWPPRYSAKTREGGKDIWDELDELGDPNYP